MIRYNAAGIAGAKKLQAEGGFAALLLVGNRPWLLDNRGRLTIVADDLAERAWSAQSMPTASLDRASKTGSGLQSTMSAVARHNMYTIPDRLDKEITFLSFFFEKKIKCCGIHSSYYHITCVTSLFLSL